MMRRGCEGYFFLFAILGMAPLALYAADAPVPPEVKNALLALRTTKDDAARQKLYATLNDKGDARLIAPLKAYLDGRLRDLDGTLIIYGDKVQIPGKGNAFPVLDAFTQQQLKEKDGSPAYLYADRLDLSAPGMMRLPPIKRAERATINDMLSTLSLLDPDPPARIQSIREITERATRALVSASDQQDVLAAWEKFAAAAKGISLPAAQNAATAVAAALSEQPAANLPLTATIPSEAAGRRVFSSLQALQSGLASASPEVLAKLKDPLTLASNATRNYLDRLDAQRKTIDELARFAPVVKRQLEKDPKGQFSEPLTEAVAATDIILGDSSAQRAGVLTLGHVATSRAANLLEKTVDAARRLGKKDLERQAAGALARAQRYQTIIHAVQNTFAGVSLGSILVLLALGLSIIFGLMGVINMAHGEFMMVGAFTTYVVTEAFKHYLPGWYSYYPIAAIPAAFLSAAVVGLLCELLVVRHLYGRPLETLLATWGIGLILIQAARLKFGDTLSVTPPRWMEGGFEVAPDLVLARNRVYIIAYCAICIAAVHLLVNRTKLGLLLRATTQNRQMAAALGVPTRGIDAITFAIGAGLAGLAGVAVPLYDKINPGMGQDYVVDSFMVVVVGGVGKLAGVIWAGLAMGFLNKYLEPLLQAFKPFASSASVIGKVVVLALIVLFLQWRPSGLFPPKGRAADA